MRVLLAQLEPVPGDPEANAALVAGTLAAHPQADLAVFGELFLGGYDLGAVAGIALASDAPALMRVRDAAREHATAVIVGYAELRADGIANAVACIDRDGSTAGVYRKTHLFGPHEQATFIAGDELLVTTLAGHRVAPLICFDVELPEPARAVAAAGAELLVTVAANMDPYGPDHELAARARALDNRRPHVYVNRAGAEGGLTFAGSSLVVDAGGVIRTALGRTADVVLADVPVGAVVPDAVDYLAHRRPGLSVVVTTSPAHTQGAPA